MKRPTARDFSGLIGVAAAAVGMVLYAAFTPPLLDAPAAAALPLLGALPGDLPAYAMRFLLAFLALGLGPLAAVLAAGESPRTLGLARPGGGMRPWMFLPLLAVALLAGLVAAYSPGTFAYYPYSRTLMRRVLAGGWGLFLPHAASYLLLYYLPWELLFRGILILPLVRPWMGGLEEVSSPGRRLACLLQSPALLAVASLQAVPSALLHFGHPVSESLWAALFGLLFGAVTLQTGSILPGLAFHAATGIGLDLFILLRHAGVLP